MLASPPTTYKMVSFAGEDIEIFYKEDPFYFSMMKYFLCTFLRKKFCRNRRLAEGALHFVALSL